MNGEEYNGPERRRGYSEDWHGDQERRAASNWDKYETKVLEDIKEVKGEVKVIQSEIRGIEITLAEMKIEIKQIVNKSATTTSSIVSVVISIISGIILYFVTGK